MLATALKFSHQLLSEIVDPGDIVVDATMGNGHDTCLLASLVGPKGQVYAFDIQDTALARTEVALAQQNLLHQVTLIHDGHQHVDKYLVESAPLKAAIFNLGYLPRSDKQIITLPATTKEALIALLSRLVSGGRIIIVCYYGHQGGPEELQTVQDYCASLPQDTYNVLSYQFINQKNNPPILFCIEKK